MEPPLEATKVQRRWASMGPLSHLGISSFMPKSHCAKSSVEWAWIDHSTWFVFIWEIIAGHSGNDNDNQFEQCSSHTCSFCRSVLKFWTFQKCCLPSVNNFHSCLCTLKTCCYRLCRTAYVLYSNHSNYTTSFVHVTFQTNRVGMWFDREEENWVVFLLFSCYTRKLRKWFTLLFA